MGAAERRESSQKMAQQMKQAGIERTTGRCPMCYQMVNIGYPQDKTSMAFHNHIISCPGPRKAFVSSRPRLTQAQAYRPQSRFPRAVAPAKRVPVPA